MALFCSCGAVPAGDSFSKPPAPRRNVSGAGSAEARLFDGDTPVSSPGPRDNTEPLVNTVIVKHSNAFTSSRHAGMSKGEQVKYIAKMKELLRESAEVMFPFCLEFRFPVTKKMAASSPPTFGFCDTNVYTAHIITTLSDGRYKMLLQREECEAIVDCYEDLYEKAMAECHELMGGLSIGELVNVRDEDKVLRQPPSAVLNEQSAGNGQNSTGTNGNRNSHDNGADN